MNRPKGRVTAAYTQKVTPNTAYNIILSRRKNLSSIKTINLQTSLAYVNPEPND